MDIVEREQRKDARKNVLYGSLIAVFSAVLGTFIATMVIMSPDPGGKINYMGVGAILLGLFIAFIYGIMRLDNVDKFLKKGN